MRNERLFRASLRVASSMLTGITSALLIELPLTRTWDGLTYNPLFCIISVIIATYIEQYLQE